MATVVEVAAVAASAASGSVIGVAAVAWTVAAGEATSEGAGVGADARLGPLARSPRATCAEPVAATGCASLSAEEVASAPLSEVASVEALALAVEGWSIDAVVAGAALTDSVVDSIVAAAAFLVVAAATTVSLSGDSALGVAAGSFAGLAVVGLAVVAGPAVVAASVVVSVAGVIPSVAA